MGNGQPRRPPQEERLSWRDWFRGLLRYVMMNYGGWAWEAGSTPNHFIPGGADSGVEHYGASASGVLQHDPPSF